MGRKVVNRAGVVAGAVIAALIVVSAALAGGSSSTSGYSNTAGIVQKGISGPKHTTHVTGTLPFTGANLALFAGAAVLLVVLGVGLRRVSRGA